MSDKSLEINCPACGKETLLMRKPKYDGFERAGETLTCTSCGHEFESEEDVPYKHREAVQVFTEEDRPDEVEVFEEDEATRLCRYCANYVVNPFMQYCSHHKKEVEATDTCGKFVRKKEEDEEAEEAEKKSPL